MDGWISWRVGQTGGLISRQDRQSDDGQSQTNGRVGDEIGDQTDKRTDLDALLERDKQEQMGEQTYKQGQMHRQSDIHLSAHRHPH
jgi:hypothetical protein